MAPVPAKSGVIPALYRNGDDPPGYESGRLSGADETASEQGWFVRCPRVTQGCGLLRGVWAGRRRWWERAHGAGRRSPAPPRRAWAWAWPQRCSSALSPGWRGERPRPRPIRWRRAPPPSGSWWRWIWATGADPWSGAVTPPPPPPTTLSTGPGSRPPVTPRTGRLSCAGSTGDRAPRKTVARPRRRPTPIGRSGTPMPAPAPGATPPREPQYANRGQLTSASSPGLALRPLRGGSARRGCPWRTVSDHRVTLRLARSRGRGRSATG